MNVDAGLTLSRWHEAEVRVLANSADNQTLSQIEAHYNRSRGLVNLMPTDQPNPILIGSNIRSYLILDWHIEIYWSIVAINHRPADAKRVLRNYGVEVAANPTFRGRRRMRVNLTPHDLRRTCARLCHAAGGELEQIQFLLGHRSVEATERYLGCRQRLMSAVNDQIGLDHPKSE